MNAITLKHLSKKFVHYSSQRDRVVDLLTAGHARRGIDFWALKDISFEISRGTTLGIIGENGSGKSTLLSIISGVLHPTHGTCTVDRKVAALLELGSCFHPEFTGRENVYLYGAAMGLPKRTIRERMDAMIEFSGLRSSIDFPIRTYSSGMVMRLAFAVIVNIDADILVIDEALAVGDIFFSQKCMRFLRSFAERGTVIFVSHDIRAVLSLCDQVLWLNDGTVEQIGHPKEITDAYFLYGLQKNQEKKQAVIKNSDNGNEYKSGKAEIVSVALVDDSFDEVETLFGGEKVTLIIRAMIYDRLASPIVGFLLKDRLGQVIFGENTLSYMPNPKTTQSSQHIEATFTFTFPLLPSGHYTMMVSIADGTYDNNEQHHWIHDALALNIISDTIRHGIVGIPFESVTLDICT